MLRASEQDENSVQAFGSFGRPATNHDASRPRGLAKTPFGTSNGRKALGNITNTKQSLQLQRNASYSEKGIPEHQRYKESVKPAVKPSAVKQAESQHSTPALKPVVVAQSSKPDQRAEKLAADGIEIQAGKGWQQQEAERALRIQQEIEARLDAMCSRRFVMPPFILQADYHQAVSKPIHACVRPPDPMDSPRYQTDEVDDAFKIEDLPEISQSDWTIEVRPGIHDLQLSGSDSDEDPPIANDLS